MRVPIHMPPAGNDLETVRLVSWLSAVGDRVERGQPIAEIETDKATVEMEALAAGVLVAIIHQAGSEVPVGAVIGELETES